ncbi:DUF6701 domain-containing protein [Glaciecola sp. SC05]|uniref:DUF6701 domain-containing protein n=1 Tax=Glaciecola sp. SC05 TaxID=1987355 RepID=UPI0035297BAC
MSLCVAASATAQLNGTVHIDNAFEAYISTDDSVQGTLIGSGTNWPTAYSFTTTLTPGQDYYLHIRAVDTGGVAAFLGEFELTGGEHTFENGLTTLITDTLHWRVSTTGWSNYLAVSGYGLNGVSPWGNRPSVDANAQWVWSADNNIDNLNFFTTKITATNKEPIANYRFDESQYTNIANEVIDSIGGFNGRASGAQPIAGKVCNAVDLSAVGTNDFVILDERILNNKTDFTLALWAKTAKTGNQSFISGAQSSNFNELIYWFQNDGTFLPYLFNSAGASIVVDSIANDIWTHFTLTREGSQLCLYKNSTLEGCVTRGTDPLDIESLILGQEQDTVGGGFVASQAFDGLIDELLVFDGAITGSQVTEIFTNQNEGWLYDGSAPSCPVETIQVPIVEYRFDECFYTQLAGDVADNSGNYSGQSNGVAAPVLDAVVTKSLDLSANTDTDWVAVPYTAVDGLDDFSMSLWFKTNVTKAQQSLFHALGANATDDELEIYLRNDDAVVVKIMDTEHVLSSSVLLTNNTWRQLAINRQNEEVCLYIDGVKQDCDNTVSLGALAVDNANSVVIGQEQDQIGGGFDVVQGFEGFMDEFKIFDVKLSGRQIAELYQNEAAGNNFDASIRPAVRCPLSCGIAGTLNAVGIRIGGGGTDTQVNTTTEAINIYDAWLAAGSPATGLIDGGTYNVNASGTSTVDRVDFGGNNRRFSGTLPYPGFASVGDQSSEHFLVQASGTVNLPAGEYSIYVESDDGFTFVLDTVSGDQVVFNRFSGSSAGANNELRFENPTGNSQTGGSFTLTQDSVFDMSTIFYERTGGDFMEVSITNHIVTSGYDSRFEIFKEGALGGKVRFGCPGVSQINHFQIIHDGQGLSCEAETVTINACTNTYDGSCSLSNQVITLDVTAAGSNTVTESISFTGTGTASLAYTLAETAVLSINNASIAASNPSVCFDGSTTNCNIVFEDAGFRFLDGNTGTSEIISNQVAATSFPLRVQAVRNSNGVCTGLFNGNTSIELSQENVNPGGTGGLSFSVNGSNIAKHPGASTTTLNFGSDSIAVIPTPVYFDAGQIRLHANYNVGGINLSGSSNAFWVSPAELVLSASVGATALNGASATSTPVHQAGEDFTLSVSALNSAGAITPNYSPGQIQFSLARTGPTLSGSVDGALSYAAGTTMMANISPSFQDVTLSSFTAGVSAYNAAQYSEVGLLNLDVQDRDYGNTGIVVQATPIDIGRFVPHYFGQTVVEDGLFQARCGTRVAFAAYSGQRSESNSSIGAISYLSNPILAITAYNKQGAITQNYFEDSQGSANDYMKLNAADISIGLPTFDQVATGVNASLLPITANMNIGTLSQNDLSALPASVPLPRGVLHYQFSSSDSFFYNRSANSKVQPFRSDIDFPVTIIRDADNTDALSTVAASPIGVEIRFGRLTLENSFGPETSNIPQVMRLEHYNGSDFVTSSDNSCTSYSGANISLSNISLDPALTSILGAAGHFINGRTQALQYQAPGLGNQGQIGVIYDTYDWLKYDWDNDGVYDNNPSAVTTFGLYRGDDRLIHWRERF